MTRLGPVVAGQPHARIVLQRELAGSVPFRLCVDDTAPHVELLDQRIEIDEAEHITREPQPRCYSGVVRYVAAVLERVLAERGIEIGALSIPPLYGASQIALGLLFIAIMILRPEGLLGPREITFRNAAQTRTTEETT